MTRKIEDLKRLNNDRVDYSKISGDLPLPNLVEIQTKSFEEFKQKGLEEVFRESFPITNYAGTLTIDFVSVSIGEPKHSYLECKTRDLSYDAPIHIIVRSLDEQKQCREEKVYMGDLPLMTKSGTFVVNGAERVIVSQLVRSPGAYLSKESKSGKDIFEADLIPSRGTWLQFESDAKDILSVRIDRQKKINATILIRALGIESDEDIRKLFGHNEALEITLEKDNLDNKKDTESINNINLSTKALRTIFIKMKPGEPITNEGIHNFLIQKFFD